MNILYASDDRFAPIAGVSILSLLENNKDAAEIDLYFINNGLSLQNKQRLMEICAGYKRKIVFLDAPDVEKLVDTSLNVGKRLSLATYYRLFICSILPADVNKIIYIDCDTIVRSSLNGLWDFELSKYAIRARSEDLGSTTLKMTLLNESDMYINAGVMLINLDLWRMHCVEEKFIKIIKVMDGIIPFYDQGVLNSVLKGYIDTFDTAYNYIVPRDHLKAYSTESPEMRSARETSDDPVIAHFVEIPRRIKMWESGQVTLFFDEWYRYWLSTPWKNGRLPVTHEYVQKIDKAISAKSKRTRILDITKRKCIPLYHLIIFSHKALRKLQDKRNNLASNIENTRHLKHIKERMKAYGIKIEDCRINPREVS